MRKLPYSFQVMSEIPQCITAPSDFDRLISGYRLIQAGFLGHPYLDYQVYIGIPPYSGRLFRAALPGPPGKDTYRLIGTTHARSRQLR